MYQPKHSAPSHVEAPSSQRPVRKGNSPSRTSESLSRLPAAGTPERASFRRALPALALFAVMIVFAWMLPLRPDYSESEKRELARFPKFSVSSMADGSWFSGISSWFSDTFPGRESWVKASNKLSGAYGLRSTAVYGSTVTADDIPDSVSADSELPAAATPAPLPAATAAPLPSSEADEEKTAVVQPQENLGKGIEADFENASSFGAVVVIDDAAYEYYGFSQDASKAYGELIGQAGDLLAGQARVFSLIVPNSMGVMLSEDTYKQFENCSDEHAGITYTYSCMGDNVIAVDVFNTLRSHNSEYIYFRTDHHWTALGAYYAYEEWAKAAGFEPIPLDSYSLLDNGDFLGTFYWQYGTPEAMSGNPDRVLAYVPNADVSETYTKDEYYLDSPVVVDMSGCGPEAKYNTFLYGDHYKTVITNNDIQDDSACLLIKDSYGNPFAVYLSQHYHTVVVIDDRGEFMLSSLVNQYGIDDVICFNSLVLTQDPATLSVYGASIH